MERSDNQRFGTSLDLPPPGDEQSGEQIDMTIGKGLYPRPLQPSAADNAAVWFCGKVAGYYGNRWLAMWQLPLVGCRGASPGG